MGSVCDDKNDRLLSGQLVCDQYGEASSGRDICEACDDKNDRLFSGQLATRYDWPYFYITASEQRMESRK